MKYVLPLLALLVIVSCRRDEQEYSTYSARDFAQGERLFGDIFEVMDEVAAETSGIRGSDCIDNIVLDTLSWPRSMLIQFGDDDCEGTDGLVRKGDLFCSFTGRYRDEGSVITITPQGYTVDGFSVSGVQTVTNMGTNNDGNLWFEVVIEDATFSPPGNGYTVSWESNRQRTWVEGDQSGWWIDDVYEITGSGSGVNRNGKAFTVQITQPLRMEVLCPWIVSGSLSLTPEGSVTRSIDYGNGECNATANLVVNGNTYVINQ